MEKVTCDQAIDIIRKLWAAAPDNSVSGYSDDQVSAGVFLAMEALADKSSREEQQGEINASDSMFGYDDDQLFTRDDEIEYIEIPLEEEIRKHYELSQEHPISLRCYIDGKQMEVDCKVDDYEFTIKATIDLRKIRKPSDLQRYVQVLLARFIEEYGDLVS